MQITSKTRTLSIKYFSCVIDENNSTYLERQKNYDQFSRTNKILRIATVSFLVIYDVLFLRIEH